MADQPRIDKGTSTGGQFTTRARTEGDVSLTAPDRPLTSTEFGIAADKGFELKDLEPNDVVSLPDGSNVEVEHADFVRDGDDIWEIVENGHYVRTHPDGHTDVLTFNDLSERASVADDLAFDAVRRTQAAASVDAPDSFWHGTEIIHTYTRSDALADGVLKDRLTDGTDLNQMAREAGIPVPVAFTTAAFEDSIAWSEKNAELQDEAGRAWDVLWMANRPIRAHAAKTNGSLRVGDRIPFTFVRVPNTPRASVPRKQTLVAVFGTDDSGAPCFTIMKTDED